MADGTFLQLLPRIWRTRSICGSFLPKSKERGKEIPQGNFETHFQLEVYIYIYINVDNFIKIFQQKKINTIKNLQVSTKAPLECMCRPCGSVEESSVIPQEIAGYADEGLLQSHFRNSL